MSETKALLMIMQYVFSITVYKFELHGICLKESKWIRKYLSDKILPPIYLLNRTHAALI